MAPRPPRPPMPLTHLGRNPSGERPLGSAAPPRPVALSEVGMGYSARTNRPWWALPPGLEFGSWWTYEQKVTVHCWREAKREVECWFRGEVYQWRPLPEHWLTEGRG
jgi:hypothetical protein